MTGPGFEFVTLGEALVVLIAEREARLSTATVFRPTVAGAESNVAIGLSRLGHRVAFIGRIGADGLGEAVLRCLRAENVDVSSMRLAELPTGVIIRDSSGNRPIEVAYYRQGSAGASLEPADVPDEMVSNCGHLHVSGITAVVGSSSRAAAEHAAQVARGAGRAVSFDPNLRRRLCAPQEALRACSVLLSLATMIFVSTDEAGALSGTSDLEGASRWFLDRGPSMVVIKRGADGAVATDGSQWWSCPAHPVAICDPVGAGDAFAAGFLSSWYREWDVSVALRSATVTAGLAMTAAADIDALPIRRDLDSISSGEVDVRR